VTLHTDDGDRDAEACRVLVIEDSVDAADTLRMLLELRGHTVEVAYGGLQGVEVAATFQPDLVLCDIGLPGLDGYQVAVALRQNPALREARLVALSGYDDDSDRERSREAGFHAHLPKPIDLSELTSLMSGLKRTAG
jgi:CheY-like chemotaxis protein